MQKIIQNSPELTIIFEFWPYGLRSAGTDPQELMISATQLGFTLFELTKKANLVPIQNYRDLIERFPGRQYTNIVAMKRT
jgi:hypothetical protein